MAERNANLCPMTAIILLASLFLSPVAQDADSAGASSGIFDRPIVIGASVSDGFSMMRGQKARVDISDAVEAALVVEHGSVQHEASMMFFRNTRGSAEDQVTAAIEGDATLVIGVDYLFWMAFGRGDDKERKARFEFGLKQLERLDCTILVGDLPDMSAASKVTTPFGGAMLPASSLPKEKTRKALNKRLRAWAKKRENTYLVPLEKFLGRLHAHKSFSFRGNKIKKDGLELMMQSDLLHTTPAGTAGITLLAFDVLVTTRKDISPTAICWDLDEVVEAMEASGGDPEDATRKKTGDPESLRIAG